MLLRTYIVTRHGHLHAIPLSLDLRIYFPQFLCSSLCLWFASFNSILILVQTLPDRVGVTHFGIVNKSNIFDSPADKIPGQLATQGPSTEKQTFSALHFRNVKRR